MSNWPRIKRPAGEGNKSLSMWFNTLVDAIEERQVLWGAAAVRTPLGVIPPPTTTAAAIAAAGCYPWKLSLGATENTVTVSSFGRLYTDRRDLSEIATITGGSTEHDMAATGKQLILEVTISADAYSSAAFTTTTGMTDEADFSTTQTKARVLIAETVATPNSDAPGVTLANGSQVQQFKTNHLALNRATFDGEFALLIRDL